MNVFICGGGEEVKASISSARARIYASMFRWPYSVPNGFSMDLPITASPRIMYAAAEVNLTHADRDTQSPRNSDPPEMIVQLKRKNQNVGPSNMADRDVICQRKRSSKYSFHPSQTLHKAHHAFQYMSQNWISNGTVLGTIINIRVDIGEDLKRNIECVARKICYHPLFCASSWDAERLT